MYITISLDQRLVERVRTVAAEKGTTLNGLIKQQLEKIAPAPITRVQRKRQLQALKRSFEAFQFKIGERTWRRDDLYGR